MNIPHVTDHIGRAISRLPKLFSPTGSVAGVASLLAARAQALEDAAYALVAASGVATAVGGQLDVLGKLVKQLRGGLTDDAYRLFIQARIKVNRGITPGPRQLSTAALLAPAMPVHFTNYPPAGFRMLLTGPLPLGGQMAALLKSGVAAGVNGEILWEESSPAATFTLDSGPGLDVGHLTGSI